MTLGFVLIGDKVKKTRQNGGLIVVSMPNQQLVEYIRGQLGAGVAKDSVYRAVISSGWSEKDVVDAFIAVEKKGTTELPQNTVSPVVQPASLAVPTTSASTAPAAQTVSPAATVTISPLKTAAPVVSSVTTMPKRSHASLYVLGGVLVLVCVLASAAYMFMPQILQMIVPAPQPSAQTEDATTTPPVAQVPTEPAATTTLGSSIYTQTKAEANPLKMVNDTVNVFVVAKNNPFAQ